MNWKRKKVLVTGAGGFIGSHLVEKLVEMGAKTTCFVRYNSRDNFGLLELLPKRTIKSLKIVAGDLKDENAVQKAARGQEIIFHLGALISIPYSYNNPRDFVQTNIIGTLNILMAAICNNRLENLIHVSSSEVYGTAIKIPIDERHPLQAQSPYSATKIGADKLAMSFYSSFGLPISIIRPFNTYGPRQSARAVIPAIVIQLFNKNNKIRIGSLEPIRDFVYIADTVRGFISIAESDKSIGEEINIGLGKGISIRNLIKKIQQITDTNRKIIVDRARLRPCHSEVFKLICDNSKAKRLFHWQPQVSLNEGLKSTIDWIKNNPTFYKTGIYNI